MFFDKIWLKSGGCHVNEMIEIWYNDIKFNLTFFTVDCRYQVSLEILQDTSLNLHNNKHLLYLQELGHLLQSPMELMALLVKVTGKNRFFISVPFDKPSTFLEILIVHLYLA